jgi:hypothetical protein
MTGIWFGGYNSGFDVLIDNYNSYCDKAPSIFLVGYRNTIVDGSNFARYAFPGGVMSGLKHLAELDTIPFITYEVSRGMRYRGWRSKFDTIGETIRGEHDRSIQRTAKKLIKFGDQHGGFFIRTMREMNLGSIWPWGGNTKKFKKAWKHIWNIFEGEGANKYATWVFNPYVAWPESIGFSYFPGEKYVDWIKWI